MKKLYFLFLLFVSGAMMAQIPQGFSYQAMALSSSGNPVASSPVKIRLSILDNSAAGTPVYVETHNPTTNAQGLFTLVIGQGQATTGTFSGINWGTNSKFLKVEIDVNNGTNYVTVGSSQLLAVPYAMYAGAVVGMGGSTGTVINSLYLYGSFNSFDPATALQMASSQGPYRFKAYKYFAAGTQLKFLTSATASAIPYGNTGNNDLGPNGSPFTVNSPGIYHISVEQWGPTAPYDVSIQSVGIGINTNFATDPTNMTYNVATNILTAIINVPATVEPEYRKFKFMVGGNWFGDNLANGFIDSEGELISFPGTGNYKIELNLNFTGDGSPYTITAI